MSSWEFPGGPGVKTRASTAVGHRFEPGRGIKIPQACWAVKNKCSFQKTEDPGKRGLLSDQSYKLPGADWESKLELRNDPFWEKIQLAACDTEATGNKGPVPVGALASHE